jgi:hypothetical protein
MNDDYLWDKSGEPDPEIEGLEKTLGRLRFKHAGEHLTLPATPRLSYRHGFSPMLAAAAALLILILAGGLWLGLRRSSSTEGEGAVVTGAAPVEKQDRRDVPQQEQRVVSGPRPPLGSGPDEVAKDGSAPDAAQPNPVIERVKRPRRYTGVRQLTARSTKSNVLSAPRREQLVREGEQAKAQLILALHIASDKLNTMQKKIQASPGS